jgi:hypothetical protein
LNIEVKLQQEIAAVNTAAFEKYKGIHTGENITVVGAGPTLNFYKPIKDAYHIGVNRVFLNDRLTLDYYFTQDLREADSEYLEKLEDIKCKFFLGILAKTPNDRMKTSESLLARLGATRYFYGPSPSEYLYLDIRYHPLMDFYTVVFPAIHFALFTNPKKLYLVGCDTSFFGYFNNDTRIDTDEQIRKHLIHRLIGYRRLKEFADRFYPETEIISINPINLRGLFHDIFTDDYIREYKSFNERRQLYGIWDTTNEMVQEFVDYHISEIE